VGFQIKRIEPGEKLQEMPEEATLQGISGQRLRPTEHETEVTEG